MAMKPMPDAGRQAQLRAELHRDLAERQRGYRTRALKLFPHLCARCGRELSGRRLKELTVHHRDHDHNNNPPDGSNWELLCLYCHDHEHEKYKIAGYVGSEARGDTLPETSIVNAFDQLDALLKKPGG